MSASYYVPVPLRGVLKEINIPPLVEDDIESFAEPEDPYWSATEAVKIVRDNPQGTPSPAPTSIDPTVTIMWIGAITAIGGLSLEIIKLLRGK